MAIFGKEYLVFRQVKDFFREPDKDLSRSLSIALRKPPQTASRMLLWSIMILIGAGFSWAALSKFPMKAVARGNITSTEPAIPIRTIPNRRVIEVAVKNGDNVKKGSVLVKLDVNVTSAEVEKLENSKNEAVRTIDDLNIQIARGTGGSGGITNPGIRAKLEFSAQSLASAQADAAKQNSLINQATADRLQIQNTLEMQQSRSTKLRTLCENGAIAQIQCENLDADLRAAQINLRKQDSVIDAAQREYDKAQTLIQQTSSSNEANIRTELKSLEEKKASIEADLNIVKKQAEENIILAPRDGTVENLNVSVGSVPSGEAMLSLRPTGKQELEVKILQTDRGTVRDGQQVEVKFDAYPSQDGNIIDGKLTKIEDSTIDDPSLGKVYLARIQVDDESLRNHRIELKTNLVATAEIITDKNRTVLQFILDPILKSFERAGATR
jgi:HlyD family secretion protein